MNELEIKMAGLSDCALVHELAEKTFPATYAAILTPEQIDYMMDWMYSLPNLQKQMVEGHQYFIASWSGTPCGYVSVEREGADLFHLQKIYVLPDHQKNHIGVALFNQAVSYIRAQHPDGPCRMELNVNRHNPARGFYEKMGMKEVSHGDFPIGHGYFMNDYIMGLDIEP
jgi:GNAT superfamily N-acetyltransferase